MNLFENFLNKILNTPLWVKQIIYLKLSEQMKEYSCDKSINKECMFNAFCPTLTFKGKNELVERKCGFDGNTYNFLQYCEKGYSILEISVNSFLSMEETAKCYEFCLEQGFVEEPISKEIKALAEYISGKTRLGEYLLSLGKLTQEQLDSALDIQKDKDDKKLGEVLAELKYVSKEELKSIIILKDEAQKRFVLDYNSIPSSKSIYSDENKKYENEILLLKSENKKLKQQLHQLLEFAKRG